MNSVALARRCSNPVEVDYACCRRLTIMAGRVLKVDGFEGKVVAIDMDTDSVVASADTPEELMRLVRRDGLENAVVVRVPELDSPLRVGLG